MERLLGGQPGGSEQPSMEPREDMAPVIPLRRGASLPGEATPPTESDQWHAAADAVEARVQRIEDGTATPADVAMEVAVDEDFRSSRPQSH